MFNQMSGVVSRCGALLYALLWEVYVHSVESLLQVEGIRRIDANDLDVAAAAAVRQNLELNDSKASGLVRPIQGDVRLAALQVRPRHNCFFLPWPGSLYDHFTERSL